MHVLKYYIVLSGMFFIIKTESYFILTNKLFCFFDIIKFINKQIYLILTFLNYLLLLYI